jgi:hypothetical protein
MIIMDKFQKRLSKLSKRLENCLVIGQGFGHLEQLVEIFQTVFVIDDCRPEFKAKNLVYKEQFNDVFSITAITMVFFDLDQVSELEKISEIWYKFKSFVIIEGDTPIGRDKSGQLYRLGYGCTSLQGYFHVWEKIK